MKLTNDVAITIGIAVVVALITEIIKHTPLDKYMDNKLTNLLTLALGLILGLVAQYIAGGEFAQYIAIGLAGAVMSSGVYEYVQNLFVETLSDSTEGEE